MVILNASFSPHGQNKGLKTENKKQIFVRKVHHHFLREWKETCSILSYTKSEVEQYLSEEIQTSEFRNAANVLFWQGDVRKFTNFTLFGVSK